MCPCGCASIALMITRFAVVCMAVALVGCVDVDNRETTQIDPISIVEVDFFGELVDADISQWQVLENGRPPKLIVTTPGGPNSVHQVGPGTLTLDDGTIIAVGQNTPGGSYCNLLGGYQLPESTCIVVGAFEPGTTTAAWFATELASSVLGDGLVMSVSGFKEGNAVLTAGEDSNFSLPVNSDARLIDCGPADLTATPMQFPDLVGSVAVDEEDRVEALHCVGDF